jgi:hypothetical protein
MAGAATATRKDWLQVLVDDVTIHSEELGTA